MLFVVTPKFWGDKTVTGKIQFDKTPTKSRAQTRNGELQPRPGNLDALTMTAGHIIQHAFSVGQ